MVQSHNIRALQPQLAPTPDRLINQVLDEGVWDLDADHYKVAQQAVAAMSVRVGSGTAFDKIVVEGDAAGQGTYIGANQDPRSGDGNGDVSIANGGAQDRIDLVVFQIHDDEFDSDEEWKGEVEVVEGDEGADPDPPDVPDSALALAEVYVEDGLDSGITDAMITDRRVQARLSPLLVGTSELPQGLLDDAEVTSNQDGITSVTDLTDLLVTIDVEAGRKVRITGHAQISMSPSGTETIAAVGEVREGSTVLGRWASYVRESSSGNLSEIQEGSVILEPSAGEHTYKLSLRRSTGSGSVGIVAGSDNPAQVAVEDIGPVPA